MIRHPRDGARWVVGAARRQSPLELGLPWMSWGAIDYLRATLRPGLRVLEWGGGGSTRFFLVLGCVVTTIESNDYWVDQIRSAAADDGTAARLDIRYVPAETREPAHVARYIAAAAEGGPWDVVVVDGLEESYVSRVDCVKAIGADAVARDGMIVLDDAWRSEYDVVPSLLPRYRRRIFKGLGPARYGVTQTDVYLPLE
jgi:hypothetical protein